MQNTLKYKICWNTKYKNSGTLNLPSSLADVAVAWESWGPTISHNPTVFKEQYNMYMSMIKLHTGFPDLICMDAYSLGEESLPAMPIIGVSFKSIKAPSDIFNREV